MTVLYLHRNHTVYQGRVRFCLWRLRVITVISPCLLRLCVYSAISRTNSSLLNGATAARNAREIIQPVHHSPPPPRPRCLSHLHSRSRSGIGRVRVVGVCVCLCVYMIYLGSSPHATPSSCYRTALSHVRPKFDGWTAVSILHLPPPPSRPRPSPLSLFYHEHRH